MQIRLDKEQKEIKEHGSYEFPLLISYEKLSNFESGSFPLHWHPEIELTLILKGDIVYQVNDQVHHLKEGEGLFCNCNALHAGWHQTSDDCEYLSVTFHPRLLYGYSSSVLHSKYVKPLTQDKMLSSVIFSKEEDWGKEVITLLGELKQCFDDPPGDYEIRLQIILLKIWGLLYENVQHEGERRGNARDTERIRKIIQYIQASYTEQITLEEVAGQVHLCRGESCRLFRRYMNETIFEYLLRYRIEKSLELLKDSTLSITQVSEKVGFATPGYFTRIFRQRMGETPMKYRKSFSEK